MFDARMTKLVALSDDAYRALAGLKRGGESFSKVVSRLTAKKKTDIMDLAGVWKGDEEIARIYARVLRDRERPFKQRLQT